MAENETASRPRRLLRLDGLRGLAACAVAFAYHPQGAFRDGQFEGYGPIVDWVHVWGWSFVDLFFILSGYVFAEAYLQAAGRSASVGWRSFWVARIARLYPLHLAMLVLCAALFFAKPENTIGAFAAHLLMLQAFVPPVGHTFDGPSWSLSVEMVCYLLFAAGAVMGPKVLSAITGAAIVGSLVFIVLVGQPGGPWPNEVLFRGLLGFFVGQILWKQRARLAKLKTSSLAMICLAGLFLNPAPLSPLLTLSLLAWPAALLLSLRAPLLERPAFRWLGERSYGIYLIHLPVIELAVLLFGKLSGGVGFVIAAHAALALVTLALADLTYRYLEKPLGRAIKQRYGSAQVAQSPGTAVA